MDRNEDIVNNLYCYYYSHRDGLKIYKVDVSEIENNLIYFGDDNEDISLTVGVMHISDLDLYNYGDYNHCYGSDCSVFSTNREVAINEINEYIQRDMKLTEDKLKRESEKLDLIKKQYEIFKQEVEEN